MGFFVLRLINASKHFKLILKILLLITTMKTKKIMISKRLQKIFLMK